MEFTKLSEVAIVETATDDDKVLIEQNGEIKRVPKTEVGGGGGGGNILAITGNEETGFTANMELTDVITILNNHELGNAYMYTTSGGLLGRGIIDAVADYSAILGAECVVLISEANDIQLFWTAAGICRVTTRKKRTTAFSDCPAFSPSPSRRTCSAANSRRRKSTLPAIFLPCSGWRPL